jgi:hypothetical protein
VAAISDLHYRRSTTDPTLEVRPTPGVSGAAYKGGKSGVRSHNWSYGISNLGSLIRSGELEDFYCPIGLLLKVVRFSGLIMIRNFSADLQTVSQDVIGNTNQSHSKSLAA